MSSQKHGSLNVDRGSSMDALHSQGHKLLRFSKKVFLSGISQNRLALRGHPESKASDLSLLIRMEHLFL